MYGHRRAVALALSWCWLVAGPLAHGAAQDKPEARPALPLMEHAARLAGRWQLTLPAGFTYPVDLHRVDDTHFRLEKAVRFSGHYEVRDRRLVLVKSPDKTDPDFTWELHAPDELTLVAHNPNLGNNYVGARLKLIELAKEGPKKPLPTPAAKSAPAPAAAQARPALPLADHAARLAGRWELKLPRSFTYQTTLRRIDDTHFRLEKAVRFSGAYELRDNRLVLVESADKTDAGFQWELHAPDELTLVAHHPDIGGTYLGATLKQSEQGPAAAAAPAAEQPVVPARRSLFFLVVALAVALLATLAGLGIWLATRQRDSAPARPRPRSSVTCPECGKAFRARDEQAGKKVKCPECGTAVSVPRKAAGE